MNDEIMVSVCCLAYNHEKYIRQCLKGFVMQKTNFKFEVLIHDDASTDGTADIIREYEEKYPDIIKPIYQTENQYSQGIKISWKYQYPRAKGKYIALCEGDDYWCDENKLQKQFDALENSEAVFCSHFVRCINENGEKTDKRYPMQEIDCGYINQDGFIHHLFDNVFPCFFTSSYFFLASAFLGENTCRPKFMMNAKVGDFPTLLALALKGGMYFIYQEMSCYRILSQDSWTGRTINDNKRVIELYRSNIDVLRAYKLEIDDRYNDLVDKKILEYEFDIEILSNHFYKLYRKRYCELFKKISKKERIRLFIKMYFPTAWKIMIKILS